MSVRLRSLVEGLQSSLFLVPMVAVILAVGGGLATVTLDSRLGGDGTDLPLALSSTVESARALLGTIAGATITFAGIAFSVSLLVIQLASSQFSPRVVHTLFRDPFNKRVMGIVIGTFTYCLIVLRSVRSPLEEGGEPVIPNLSVAIGLVLGITAILAVVAFINHNAHAMDVSNILERVKRDAIEHIQASWDPAHDQTAEPADEPTPPAGGRSVEFEASNWVQFIDTDALLAAIPDGATITLHTYPGRYAIEGTAICSISHQAAADVDAAAIRASIAIGDTRTMQQDVSYGLRQLTDVTLRALSPGVNDPTTAQDAIFHATAVLAELLRRQPPGPRQGERQRTLLCPEAPDHVELIQLTFDEPRRAAVDAPTVCIYLLEALRLLGEATGNRLTPAARNEIRTQAHLVVTGCEQANPIPADLQAVRHAHQTRFP